MSRAAKADLPFVALLGLLAIPWSVQVFAGGDATFLFAWGLLNTDPLSVTSLFDFLFVYTRGLPDYILAWPLSAALYVLALANAVVGRRTGREDRRVTAGLLVFAAVAQGQLAWGFSVQPGRVAWPVGSIALLAVAAVYYRAGRTAGGDERRADRDG